MNPMAHNIDHNDMTEKVNEYRRLNAQAARLIQAKRELGRKIKREMIANGIFRMSAGDYTVRAVTHTRRRFDVAAFRRDYPHMADSYTVISDVHRFTVE